MNLVLVTKPMKNTTTVKVVIVFCGGMKANTTAVGVNKEC